MPVLNSPYSIREEKNVTILDVKKKGVWKQKNLKTKSGQLFLIMIWRRLSRGDVLISKFTHLICASAVYMKNMLNILESTKMFDQKKI